MGMCPEAWSAQSNSLVEVQKKGEKLESLVKDLLGWEGGRVVYEPSWGYSVQVDCAYPSTKEPQAIASVTYTSPDKPGHSNENKLHLKVGELTLLKRAFPEVRMILILGGDRSAWLPYVLEAFIHFFDEVVFLWEPKGFDRLKEIAKNPLAVSLNNQELWGSIREEYDEVELCPKSSKPPCSLVRYGILDVLKEQPIVHNPSLIENEVARLCMERSYEQNGAEWANYLQGNWHNIEMSRNYFNPSEAVVEISLRLASLSFQGGIARDVPVRSLLHSLGMPHTRVSEDFVLYSKLLKLPVYIQCKASGGGRGQHGKNIQNRTKEQINRSIIYRCSNVDGKIVWGEKQFHWISVLDGDWGVSQREPLKYVHMLQLVGYDKIICVGELLESDMSVKKSGNLLVDYLTNTLQCRVDK